MDLLNQAEETHKFLKREVGPVDQFGYYGRKSTLQGEIALIPLLASRARLVTVDSNNDPNEGW